MKTIFTKMGILMTLIFSFLFSMFSSNSIYASEGNIENGQDYVNLTSISENDDIITFSTRELYNIKEITYEICYTINDIKEANLITTDSFIRNSAYSYSFNIGANVVGVKIHKIRYVETSEDHTPSKMTTGNNTWGDMSAYRKKNYIEVTTDKLELINVTADVAYTNAGTGIFYFNLDTEIDYIEKIDFEYAVRTEESNCSLCSKNEYITTYEQVVDHNADVLSEDFFRVTNSFINKEIDVYEYDSLLGDLKNKGLMYRKAFGVNTNGNGYSWYLQPLLDRQLVSETNRLGGYKYEILQEVALIKMSYYFQGEYFEDAPVLDEDTGWNDYIPPEKESDLFDKLIQAIDWIIENWWKVLIGIAVGIIVIWTLIKFGIKAIFVGVGYVLKYLFLAIWFILKWTIFLPITLIVRHAKKKDDDVW